nr:VOC family protein [uncultured Massilia sp.]
MMDNPVGWFEIYVQDMERAKAFYSKVFEVTLERIVPEAADTPGLDMWAFPMAQGGRGAAGALARMDDMASGGNSVIVYFNCDDCAVEAGRAAKAGGRIARAKFSIGKYGNIAIVEDTEGNVIGLHSMR